LKRKYGDSEDVSEYDDSEGEDPPPPPKNVRLPEDSTLVAQWRGK
jgi:hypothetical protein